VRWIENRSNIACAQEANSHQHSDVDVSVWRQLSQRKVGSTGAYVAGFDADACLPRFQKSIHVLSFSPVDCLEAWDRCEMVGITCSKSKLPKPSKFKYADFDPENHLRLGLINVILAFYKIS
jgi:hypothetical protein